MENVYEQGTQPACKFENYLQTSFHKHPKGEYSMKNQTNSGKMLGSEDHYWRKTLSLP